MASSSSNNADPNNRVVSRDEEEEEVLNVEIGQPSTSRSLSQPEELITPEQTALIVQFQELTQLDQIDQCKEILKQHNWDFAEAISSHFAQSDPQIAGPEPIITEPPSGEVRRRNVPGDNRDLSPQVLPQEQQQPAHNNNNNNNQVGLFSSVYHLISWPFTFFYESFLSIVQFTWTLIRGDPRRHVVDPVGDVARFIEAFEAKYGTNHPKFSRKTYKQALDEAKRDLKFLLVYLHSERHQDTDNFCTTVLTHQEVVNYINRNNILFWGCSIAAPEGYRVSNALKENTYPFLGLIGLQENRMLLVRRYEGKTTVERLLAQLQQGIQDNEASLVAARADRQALSMNQQIRRDQDEAYLESLRADQEKERKRKEEQDKRDAEDKIRRDQEQQELQLRERLLRLKVDLVDRIPVEPAENVDNVIRILVKLPNGSRLERRFLRTMSIKSLAYFIFCQSESPVSFQVGTNYPRKVITECKPPTLDNPDCTIVDSVSGQSREPPTFEELGLVKDEMLYVADLEA